MKQYTYIAQGEGTSCVADQEPELEPNPKSGYAVPIAQQPEPEPEPGTVVLVVYCTPILH